MNPDSKQVNTCETLRNHLDQLLKRTVDWRADLGTLVEIDSGDGTLADALGCEFEFLERSQLSLMIPVIEEISPCKHPCTLRRLQIYSDRIARVSTVPSLVWT